MGTVLGIRGCGFLFGLLIIILLIPIALAPSTSQANGKQDSCITKCMAMNSRNYDTTKKVTQFCSSTCENNYGKKMPEIQSYSNRNVKNFGEILNKLVSTHSQTTFTASCKGARLCGFCENNNDCPIGRICNQKTCQCERPAQACGNGIIEGTEKCDGGACCNADCTLKPSSSECRAQDGPCDIAEFCSGTSAACPTDSVQANGYVCANEPGQCEANDICDGTTKNCNELYAPLGTPCDDGNACTKNQECSDGTCAGGSVETCDDANPCTDDICDPVIGCTNVPNTDACDDGLYCTVSDQCASGACNGIARDCSALSNQCNLGVCNEGTDACETQPANQGNACDDGLYCTYSDSCSLGSCIGIARNCDDSVGCTVDACDEQSYQCTHTITDPDCINYPYPQCKKDASCNSGEFCDFPAGQCGVPNLTGACKTVPAICPANYSPICGCDATIYGNDCERMKVKVQLDHSGVC